MVFGALPAFGQVQDSSNHETHLKGDYFTNSSSFPRGGRSRKANPFADDTTSEKTFQAPDEDHFALGPSSKLIRNASTTTARAALLRNTSSASGRVRRPYHNPPVHMPGWSSMLPRVDAFFRFPLRPRISMGKALILLGYSILMFYAGLYKSNPFTQPIRAGWVAASQVPVIVVLATKNNIIGMMLGVGYERLNFMHRYASRFFVLAVNVHAIGYIFSWSLSGTFHQHLKTPVFQSGLAGLVAVDLITLTSLSFIREKFHPFFITTHIISIITIFVSICFHSRPSVPYILVALGAYGLDRLIRLVKTKYKVARLTALPELGMTRIEVLGVNAGWRAGQHIRIRVLSRGMGLFGWAECHPFSIVSVSKGFSEEGLVLMCKKTGKWTTRLFDLARRIEFGEIGRPTQDVKVLIEGPYGGPGHTMFASFSGAMFVAGGSGITFALGAFQDAIQKDLEGESRLKGIELVWAVQDPIALLPLLPLFTDLLSLRTYATVKISVYYTRSGTQDSAIQTLSSLKLPEHLTVSTGRPKLGQHLSGILDQACALSMFKRRGGGASRSKRNAEGLEGGSGLNGVIVGVCGPGGLADDVRKMVRASDERRRKAVGGIEVHEELFGW